MKCPFCGKELIKKEKDIYVCNDCNINIEIYPDEETPVSMYNDYLRVDWYRAGEGYWGDYNPANIDDEELLRFDVYKKEGGDWVEVEDASYCTYISANAEPEILVKPLAVIFKNYRDADLDYSVKKLGEALSWIDLSCAS
jgi:transcription elongation factor Elf1